MKNLVRIAAIPLLAMTLAACGEEAEKADDPVDASGQAPEAIDAPVPEASDPAAPDTADGQTPVAEETPAAPASPTPASAPSEAIDPPAAFAQCSICHSVNPGENGIGPTLAGVFGRRSATVSGFAYSPAMKSANLNWNQANLDRYLADPAGVVPGTTMALPGMDGASRAAVITYLKSL